jgi:uncharacterized UPF0160 family protein
LGRHFGKEVIANTTQLPISDPKIETLWLKVYKVDFFFFYRSANLVYKTEQEFIEAIDAIDNGIPQYPGDIKPRYTNRTDLSSRVGALNPAWNQPIDSVAVDVSSFRNRFILADLASHRSRCSREHHL